MVVSGGFPTFMNVVAVEVGCKVVEYNSAMFEILSRDDGKTTLRCVDPDPRHSLATFDIDQKYSAGDMIVIDNDTEISIFNG